MIAFSEEKKWHENKKLVIKTSLTPRVFNFIQSLDIVKPFNFLLTCSSKLLSGNFFFPVVTVSTKRVNGGTGGYKQFFSTAMENNRIISPIE